MQSAALDTVMRTLADPTRRSLFERIVHAQEINVVELTKGSGVTQSAISQHLGSLRRAGLVLDRAQGRNVYYRANPKGWRRLPIGWATTACSGASAWPTSERS